jgi:hypothetical protein
LLTVSKTLKTVHAGLKRAVSKKEGEKFWSIYPPKQGEQEIVAFPVAS